MKVKSRAGYTIIELMLVVTIMAILFSIASPQARLLITKAHQAKTKSNLGTLRSTIGLFYSENEGVYPHMSEPNGAVNFRHQLMPRYIGKILPPTLKFPLIGYNNMSVDYDSTAFVALTSEDPAVKDTMIVNAVGPQPNVNYPFCYIPREGHLFINNDNDDTGGGQFYEW